MDSNASQNYNRDWCICTYMVGWSAAAYFVVSTLKNLAKEGCTVISSIHQPSSEVFVLFDNLTLLSNGHTIYFGETANASEVIDLAHRLFWFATVPVLKILVEFNYNKPGVVKLVPGIELFGFHCWISLGEVVFCSFQLPLPFFAEPVGPLLANHQFWLWPSETRSKEPSSWCESFSSWSPIWLWAIAPIKLCRIRAWGSFVSLTMSFAAADMCRMWNRRIHCCWKVGRSQRKWSRLSQLRIKEAITQQLHDPK